MNNNQNKDNFLKTEMDRLIVKCDKQLDHIKKQESIIKEKDNTIKHLKIIQEKMNTANGSKTITEINNFVEVYQVFFLVVKELIKNNEFFEKKNITENSIKYSTVEFSLLSSYIKEFSKIYSTKKILERWKETGLIYVSPKNGSYVVNSTQNSKTIRSVRINNIAIDRVKECMLVD